jgi:hypothetical protein
LSLCLPACLPASVPLSSHSALSAPPGLEGVPVWVLHHLHIHSSNQCLDAQQRCARLLEVGACLRSEERERGRGQRRRQRRTRVTESQRQREQQQQQQQRRGRGREREGAGERVREKGEGGQGEHLRQLQPSRRAEAPAGQEEPPPHSQVLQPAMLTRIAMSAEEGCSPFFCWSGHSKSQQPYFNFADPRRFLVPRLLQPPPTSCCVGLREGSLPLVTATRGLPLGASPWTAEVATAGILCLLHPWRTAAPCSTSAAILLERPWR